MFECQSMGFAGADCGVSELRVQKVQRSLSWCHLEIEGRGWIPVCWYSMIELLRDRAEYG